MPQNNNIDKRSEYIRGLVGKTRKYQCRADEMTTFDSENLVIDNLSISSESEEVVRYNWSNGREYIEILSHNAEDADLSRFNDGAPFLLDHDRKNQIGVIEHAEISGTKCRMRVRFSKSGENDDARRIFDEMKDRIRKNVSVSYEIVGAELVEQGDEDKGTLDKIRLKWIGLEGSSVTVPADSTVGVDRSGSEIDNDPSDTARKAAEVLEAAQSIKDSINPKKREVEEMPNTNTDPIKEKQAAPVDVASITARAIADHKAERQSINAELTAIADANPTKPLVRKIVGECIAADLTLAESHKRIMTEGFGATEVDSAIGSSMEFSKAEVKSYSISRALAAHHDGKWQDPSYNSFEKEITLELCGRFKKDPNTTGILVPSDALNAGTLDREAAAELKKMRLERFVAGYVSQVAFGGKRDLNTGTATAGGNIVATDLLSGSFIEYLKNAMKTYELGMRTLTGLNGNVAIPSKSGMCSTYWTAEGAATTESELTFGQLSATPKQISALSEYTYNLLVQGNPSIDALVKADHADAHALGIDLAVLVGTGSSNQPTGIVNTTNVNTVPIGTDGGAPTDAHFIDMETAIADDNAVTGPLKYLVTSGTKGKLKKTAIESGQTDRVWNRATNMINNLESHVSNQLPSDGTKGTGTSLHTAFLGDWTQVILAMWGTFEMLTDPYTGSAAGIIRVVSRQLVDVIVRHPESFCYINDIDIA